MLAACLVPIALQAGAMLVDELWFHRRRELPRWERIGHPLDTLTIVVCLGWLLAGGGLGVYIGLAIASTLFVTKDEGVHARLCGAGEQWLHAVLFALHPIVLAGFGYLAWSGHRGVLVAQLAVTLAFMAYQVVFWNVIRRARSINNEWYADLGERWYVAEDTPIALLRAESRQRNPWVADEIVRTLGPAPMRVLDLGCGAGFLSNYLAARGHDVTGIDTTAENLTVARAHGTATYELGDACALPYPDASFDVVCAMDLIEHVDHPDELVAEAARVLRPGGRFFFHTFNRTQLANLIVIKGVAWFVKNAPDDLHVLHLFRTPEEVEQMCRDAGLEVSVLRGSRPRFRWPLFRMLLTGKVGDDFAFTFTGSTAIGYTGHARRLDLGAADRPHERVVPEVHERHDHRDRP
ncbi:MAG TPA: bifunctional 2-polyprenyl-6-hydroxyphenol methylase/3-demethylubiquinol 3-O-methyltransferase UbiG [Kofleriaceae bacterium]|nr:bifunctional 2-polyprenyl-6-hydroxyphenol methylase/3-demethylubiquinol 3-O-methyltransferase UbiG [Kofleriaceae bacterium]